MRSWMLSLALLACPAWAAGVDWARADVQVELRPRFVAHTTQVTLGDVAVIRTQDADAIRQLVNLSLGNAPVAGDQASLDRESVARWMRMRLGIAGSAVQWSGASEVRVIGGGTVQTASREEAMGASRAALAPVRSVTRGDWVQFLVKSGVVQLESRGQALQDGAEGQVILVRISNVASPLYARVLGAGRVEAMP